MIRFPAPGSNDSVAVKAGPDEAQIVEEQKK